MRFRDKSIRRRIGVLVALPLLSLVSVWAFATALTLGEARQVLAASSATDALRTPTADLAQAIQVERRQTLVFLGDPRRADALSALERFQEATDATAAAVRREAGAAFGDLGDGAADAYEDLTTALEDLPQLRGQVRSNTVSLLGALDAYNSIADPTLRLAATLRPAADVTLDRQGRAVVGIAQAREYLSREDALVAGALAAGRTTPDELRALRDRMRERELAYAMHLPELPPEDRQAHEGFWESATGRLLRSTERDLLDGGAGAVSPEQWDEAGAAALDDLGQLVAEAADRHQAGVSPENTAVVVRAAVVGGGGLLALLLAAFVALRIGRRHLRELRTLARESRDAAEVRLPGVKRRLAAGERVDVETEAPRLEYGPDDLGQVGQALNTLQRAALSAEVERCVTRRGVSEVFVNLARRGQVLLHRQIHLLKALERRTEDPGDLADLIRLGHLTARMRRHAEGLVVLSGSAPARQWGKPEQLMDVVRAAVDEVEDYERVELRRLPLLTVSGCAVADLTHLIAELLENATVFSPPHTAVQVSGERVPHGFTMEIHDRGLGMTADALREANERLARPDDFQLTDTDRLGLYVVSRLAERHGVRVALKDSPYGGTTAVALIPGELLSESDGAGHGELPGTPPPSELNGPVDGPVELEAPLPVAEPEPALPPATGHPADAAGHAAAREPDEPVPLRQRHRPPMLVSDHGRPVRPVPPATPGDSPSPARARLRQRQRPDSGGADGPPTTSAGLPRRIRRGGPTPASGPGPRAAANQDDAVTEPSAPGPPGGHPEPGAPPPDVDADAVRTRMAALQRGWRRGRQQSDPERGETPPGPRP